MEAIALSINGKNITCRQGASIFEAAEQNGFYIPSLCRHPALEPHGACRLCLVEDEESGRLFASCVTPAAGGMKIHTDSPRVLRHRRNIVRLMMAEHPESCLVCSKGNKCELRRIASMLGLGESDLYPMPNLSRPFEHANPFIVRDLSKCILCGRCIRADHELVCAGAIDYNDRGFSSRPSTVHEMPLERSSCTFCGTCVSICPTGALSPADTVYVGTPEREAHSVCGFCGVGCILNLGVSGGRVVEVNPAEMEDSVNRYTLCVRGHFAHDFLNSRDRLSVPLVKSREGGEDSFSAVSWEEALDRTASTLSDIKRKFGPQSIAFIGSSKCSIEENYLFQKIARTVFNTENVASACTADPCEALMTLDEKTGGILRTNRLSELESSQAIMVLGPDPDHAAPVLASHIKRAAKKGARLIVVNPVPNDLALFAELFIQPDLHANPGASAAAFINAVAAEIISGGGQDQEFINSRTKNFQAYSEYLDARGSPALAGAAGVKQADAAAAAEIIKGRKTAFIAGQVPGSPLAGNTMEALFNLALAAGSLEGPGCGIFIAAGENNRLGACDMGISPSWLPGRTRVSDEDGRKRFEKAWNTKLSPDPGLGMTGIIEAAEKGNLKAVYIMGENPARSLPGGERVVSALGKLDFVAVQDILFTRTAGLADVVLPGASFAEKAGAFANMEGRIQNFNPVVPPPGQAKPDWEILSLLAARMGHPEKYDSLAQIKQEIRRLVPVYADLGSHRQGWVKSREPGEDFRFEFTLPADSGKKKKPSGDFPLTGILGHLRFHMGSGTRTSRSDRIQSYELQGHIEISPHDAEKLDLEEEGLVRLASHRGSIERKFWVNPRMPAGQVFVPMAYNGNDALNLLDPSELPAAGMAGWRICSLRIEKPV